MARYNNTIAGALMRLFILLFLFIIGCSNIPNNSVISGVGQAPSFNNALFSNGFFLIGTWIPNPDEMAKWKARGVNTVFGQPNGIDPAWDAQAISLGLKRVKRQAEASDVGNPDVIAWLQIDEPNNAGQTQANLAPLSQKYDEWKAMDPTKPVIVNFAGAILSYDPTNTDALLGQYIDQTLDWICNDYYPVTNGVPLTEMAVPIDKISRLTSKPQLVFIETSDQDYSWSHGGPTPEQVKAEIWLAIVRGVKGIIYYPQSTTSPDATLPDVAAEITTQNAIISSLGPVLQGKINPSEMNALAPSPLRFAWWHHSGGNYLIVVNPTPSSLPDADMIWGGVSNGFASISVLNEGRTLALDQGNFSDSFEPYAVHIYVIGAP